MKVVGTPELLSLSWDAAKRQYNRQLDSDRLEKNIDPDGVHILEMFMIHEHKHGLKCEPHARCRVLIKVKGKDEPVEAWLDIELGKFDKLMDMETVNEKLAGFGTGKTAP